MDREKKVKSMIRVVLLETILPKDFVLFALNPLEYGTIDCVSELSLDSINGMIDEVILPDFNQEYIALKKADSRFSANDQQNAILFETLSVELFGVNFFLIFPENNELRYISDIHWNFVKPFWSFVEKRKFRLYGSESIKHWSNFIRL